MPPEEVMEKAPQKASFDSGLLSNDALEETLDQNQNLINGRRSFMDKGEDVLTQEQLQEKENAAESARATLLARMKEENDGSLQDAEHIREEHERHKQQEMDAAIDHAREKRKESYIAKAEYLRAWSRTGLTNAREAQRDIANLRNDVQALGQDEAVNAAIENSAQVINNNVAQSPNAFVRWITFSGARARSARSTFNKTEDASFAATRNIIEVSRKWDEYLDQYKKNTYKVRSRNYDRLFRKYYMLSRGKQMDAEGEGRKFRRENEAGFEEANRNHAKNITEYTGKYNNPTALYNAVLANPFVETHSEIVPGKTLAEGSLNIMDGTMKRHTMVTMEAFGKDADNRQLKSLADEQALERPVQRVRIKIDNSFRGYRAKRQLNEEGELTVDNNFAGKSEENRSAMSGLNLVVDEKGANNQYLFSQRSAKLYSARSKRTGQRTNGFFIDGEFVSADKDVMTRQEEAAYFGSPNFNTVQRQEKLRNAIRRSDFFRHINSGTIQYYMNYDDTTGDVSNKNVERKFMARRDSLFSLTSLGQNLYDGTLAKTVGGLVGTTILDAKNIPVIPKNSVDKVWGKYANTAGSMAKLDKAYNLGYIGTGFMLFAPLGAALGKGSEGASISVFLGTCVSIFENITKFIDLKKKWGKAHPGDRKWPLVSEFIDNTLGLLSNIASVIDTFAEELWSDQVKSFLSIIKNVMAIIKDVVTFIGSGIEKHYITKSDRSLATAMDAYQEGRQEGNEDQYLKGESLSKNTQAGMFLTLARRRANRDMITTPFDAISQGLDATGTMMGLGEKASWFNPISLPFKLGGKVVSFLGMGVNKLVGLFGRKNNIETILGDRDLDKTPGFDMILKEETGINNKHYISDLVRTFMAIDTHCLLNKSAANNDNAGLNLALDVLGPYYAKNQGESINDFVRRVSFNRLISIVGAPKDWRNVLLESIS